MRCMRKWLYAAVWLHNNTSFVFRTLLTHKTSHYSSVLFKVFTTPTTILAQSYVARNGHRLRLIDTHIPKALASVVILLRHAILSMFCVSLLLLSKELEHNEKRIFSNQMPNRAKVITSHECFAKFLRFCGRGEIFIAQSAHCLRDLLFTYSSWDIFSLSYWLLVELYLNTNASDKIFNKVKIFLKMAEKERKKKRLRLNVIFRVKKAILLA